MAVGGDFRPSDVDSFAFQVRQLRQFRCLFRQACGIASVLGIAVACGSTWALGRGAGPARRIVLEGLLGVS